MACQAKLSRATVGDPFPGPVYHRWPEKRGIKQCVLLIIGSSLHHAKWNCAVSGHNANSPAQNVLKTTSFGFTFFDLLPSRWQSVALIFPYGSLTLKESESLRTKPDYSCHTKSRRFLTFSLSLNAIEVRNAEVCQPLPWPLSSYPWQTSIWC